MKFLTTREILMHFGDIKKAVVACYFIYRTNNLYHLYYDYKPKTIESIYIPPILNNDNNDIDIDKLSLKKYKDIIINFKDTLKDNISIKDLTNFNNNIIDLKIRKRIVSVRILPSLILHGKIPAGLYNGYFNNISIYGSEVRDHFLYHELFHIASTSYKEGVLYSGFSQSCIKKNYHIGKGINEGYTELLTQRYFGYKSRLISDDNYYTLNDNNDIVYSYVYQVFIAKNMEQIVGKDRMQELYFKSNLLGLIYELNKYNSEEEIMRFISDMDFVSKYSGTISLIKKDIISICLKNISYFLITSYINKLKKENKKEEEVLNELAVFISSFNTNSRMQKYKCKIDTREVIEKACFDDKNDIIELKKIKRII